MSTTIVPIRGNTAYTINLDPSVWIFDKRKINLELFLASGERAEVPEREASGSYGIPFEPFLNHAEPLPNSTAVQLVQANGEKTVLTLAEAANGILGFAEQGKALKSSGPIIFYHDHQSKEPIPQVVAFEVIT
ncbi:hypothetical protein [Bacillus horti]|uniref:Peptidyl-prolyl cis-trans isomerase n=1 Tax=Caldalkalibacillus horti TaxID=77523 RepID=A0ABT9W3K2_9BACI|nr:hypothetical protein [Bacillus horti]MDQ0167829.1 hypothetical protein [Bacillus horti]